MGGKSVGKYNDNLKKPIIFKESHCYPNCQFKSNCYSFEPFAPNRNIFRQNARSSDSLYFGIVGLHIYDELENGI
jgi:hypothetical protein